VKKNEQSSNKKMMNQSIMRSLKTRLFSPAELLQFVAPGATHGMARRGISILCQRAANTQDG